MTDASYRLPPGTFDGLAPGAQVVLDGDEGHHAADVKRHRPGESILLADGSDRLAEATIATVEPGRLVATINAFASAGYPGPRFTLVQALAKGDRDLMAIEAATELGIDAVIPWRARRCVVVWRPERVAKALRKWRTTVEAAVKQSRRPAVPEVSLPLTTRELTAGVAELTASGGLALVLHEHAEASIVDVTLPAAAGDPGPANRSPGVWLLVGPEGGIAPEEVEALVAAGAMAVRTGSHVLRSSTAGPAALAVLSARQRWA